MADGGPGRPIVPPTNQKRRRTNRDRRSSSAEFVILADDGSQHVVEAVDPPYESDYINVEETSFRVNLRVTRSRAREETSNDRPAHQASTLANPQGGPTGSPARNHAVDAQGNRIASHPWSGLPGDPEYWERLFEVDPHADRSIIPSVEDHQPDDLSERPEAPLTQAQIEVQLRLRITELEAQTAALQNDNAALGVEITESNNVPHNDRDGLLDLVRTTNTPRSALLRLLDNDDFLERWRTGSRRDGSEGNGSRGGGGGSRGDGSRGDASGRGGSERGGCGRRRGRGGSRERSGGIQNREGLTAVLVSGL